MTEYTKQEYAAAEAIYHKALECCPKNDEYTRCEINCDIAEV